MIRRRFHRPCAAACLVLAAAAAVYAASVYSAIAQEPGLGVDNKPTFLVATRELGDPIFEHSVVLMIPPQEPPLIAGLIINKPSRMTLHDVFPDVSSLKDRTDSVYFGGPVDYTTAALLMRQRSPSGKGVRVLDGVYLRADRDSIASALKAPPAPSDLRFVMGRAQWSREQLRSEIQEGSWYVVPATAEQVFSSNPKRLWEDLISHSGQEVRWNLDKPRFALLYPPIIAADCPRDCSAPIVARGGLTAPRERVRFRPRS